MCFGCSKEPSHLDVSFKYPQHMFWFRNKNNNFQLHTLIRDANQSDFCGIILIFKADFRITISNIKLTTNDDFKMVPDKIMGVTLTSTLIIPDHW